MPEYNEAGAGLLSTIGQDPDGNSGGASRGGDPGPDVFGLLQQRAGLIVERGPSAGERDRGRRTVKQHRAKIGLQLLDRPAQRRLGHVQPRGRAAEVPFLGHGHEVTQRAQVHQQQRYRQGIEANRRGARGRPGRRGADPADGRASGGGMRRPAKTPMSVWRPSREVRDDLTLEQILDMIIAIASINGDPGYSRPILQAALDGLRPGRPGR
jgi:hypothetical protein